jgi:hypothetical protein
MTGGLVRASETEIARLRRNSSELPAFIEGDEWAPPLREVRLNGVLGWLLKLSPITVSEIDPDAVPPEDYQPGPRRPTIDFDKAWHPLQYLFTGTAWEGDEPGCFLTRGGEELGDEDLGYSTIRALSPAQMRQFDEFLHTLSHEELRRRYDPGRMVALEIYAKNCAPTGARAVKQIEHLLEMFDELRAFVKETAAAGHGAISYLT